MTIKELKEKLSSYDENEEVYMSVPTYEVTVFTINEVITEETTDAKIIVLKY